MTRWSIRLFVLGLAVAGPALWGVATAQTTPSPSPPSEPITSTAPATQPATRPAVPDDPTIPNEQLRRYLQQMAQKDHATPAATAKPLEIALQALVVNNRGEGTAILTISGHGSVTVGAGSVIALSGDASGPQVKILAISANGVEVLLPQAKTPITIK